MLIQCVVVGIDHWDDLTRPFLEGLRENNKNIKIICVDNQSNNRYPGNVGNWITLRISDVPGMGNGLPVGYGAALNSGSLDWDWGENWDWLLCCNNDCICDGDIEGIISRLQDDTVYGNAWKLDYSGMKRGLPAVVDSAYLLIPRKVWDVVGPFDTEMDAAFEEIDYQIRVLDAGYRVDVLDLPITHLNLHTRHELKGYNERWHETEKKFLQKHPERTD